MPKKFSDPVKVGKEIAEKINQWYERMDFPGPRITVCAALQHLSAAMTTKYSMQINTLDPMQLAYFGAANGEPQTIIKLLQFAWMKAWLVNDRETYKILKPYYRMFKDELTEYLKSSPTFADAEEKLDIEPESGNIYRQAFWRYKSCMEHPRLFRIEFIDCMPFQLDWIGAWFCHLVRIHLPDMEPKVMEILPRHPGFIGHLAEISDEYRQPV